MNNRVYIVITTFLPFVGGAETQTFSQAQHLQQQGYEPTIVTFHHKKEWAAEEVLGDIRVKRVAGKWLGNREHLPRIIQRLYYLLAMLLMGWTLWNERKNYDVLHVCQLSLLILPITLACRLARKPMLIVIMSAGAGKAVKSNEPVRLLAGPLDVNSSWLTVDGQTWIDGDLDALARKGKALVNYMFTHLRRISATIVVLSSRMEQQFTAYGRHIPRLEWIPNGVDQQRFSPVPPELQTNEWTKTVICVSKMRYEKGIDVLLQAWHLVHIQAPQARLILVGTGPLQKQLEQMAKALGIAGTVEFTGLQSDVPAQLRRGSIAVLPSRWEGMPNALLEAMATGLACVATRVSGSEDLIQPEVNGYLIEPEDYHAMGQVLLNLLNEPELSRRLGQTSYEIALKNYTIEQITRRYTGLYQRLISLRQPMKQVQPETAVNH